MVDKPTQPASEGGDTPTEGDAASGDTPSQDQVAAPGIGDTGADTSQPQAELPDPTEADLRKLRPETRRRIEQLLKQRNDARSEAQLLQPEVTQWRDLQSRLQTAQLAPEDMNTFMALGSALRQGKYQEFLDGAVPFVLAAQEFLGQRIAADLQKQVDDGLISEDAARELTATRHRANRAEANARDVSQARMSDQQVQTVTAIRSAVERWEQGIRTRDPDFAQKADTVRRFSQGLLQERGAPTTPDQAVALVQAAYDEVNKTFGAMRPAPRPTRPTPSSVHVATSGASAEPRTMKEAALAALAQMRRAS